MRFSSTFSVDLQNLNFNYTLLKKIAPKNKIIFMVKANAYGHGLKEITQFANDELGIEDFGCASLGEAIFLKKSLSSKIKTWVFSDTEIYNENFNHEYLDPSFQVIIHSYSQLEFVLNHKSLNNISLNLKFDTGMNRIGIKETEVESVIQLLKIKNKKSLNHILTHFSESYFKIKPGDRTDTQYKLFLKIKDKLVENNIDVQSSSVSNSGAIEQGFGLEETYIRPGLMLYGPASVGSYKKSERLWFGKSLSSFSSKVIKVERLSEGSKIGYGGHVLKKEYLVAYLPIGYGDGLLTYYTGAFVHHLNYQGEILGRVNMDMVAIGFHPKDEIKLGDVIYIWRDDENSVLEFCNQVKSIPYQLFTTISQRIPKEYLK